MMLISSSAQDEEIKKLNNKKEDYEAYSMLMIRYYQFHTADTEEGIQAEQSIRNLKGWVNFYRSKHRAEQVQTTPAK